MKSSRSVVLFAVFAATVAHSDTLYFKSGNSYECQVLDYSNETFAVLLDGNKMEAPLANVEWIKFAKTAPTNALSLTSFTTAVDFQEDAKYTPKTYLEGKSFGEAVDSCSPKELGRKLFTLENKLIKLVFKRRSEISQIGTNEYKVSLYDDDYESVTAYFDNDGLQYIRSIKEDYEYGEPHKKYVLYGIPLSPKTLEDFQNPYRWGRQVLLPVGKTKTRPMGNQPTVYSW